MSTVIRPEVSEKSRWYISKHRYYELRHFCLQYPEWQEECNRIDDYILRSYVPRSFDHSLGDPTAYFAMRRAELTKKMQLVKEIAMKTDPDLWTYIFDAVTKEHSFVYLRYTLDMPAEKKMYFDRYRKFFWLLSKVR